MRQGRKKLADLPVVASRSDSLIPVQARGTEGGRHAPWPQTRRRLNNTPTPCLKIHGVVEPPRGAAVSLPRPGWLSSSSTSRQCEAPRCRVPPAPCCLPTPIHNHNPNGPMPAPAPPRGAGQHHAGRHWRAGGARKEPRQRRHAACLIVVRCRSCEALGSEKEITQAARQRMRLTAQVLEGGTHTHPHTVGTVSTAMGPRRSDTLRAEIYSSLHIRTVL